MSLIAQLPVLPIVIPLVAAPLTLLRQGIEKEE